MIPKLLFLILPEQENFSALIVEPATGCGTPGSYGKNYLNWQYGFLKIYALSKTYHKPNHKI